MRSRRCNKCQESFYSLTAVATCQNCTESHDPIPQATRDAEALAQANPPVTTALPQSVDPRGPTVPEGTTVEPKGDEPKGDETKVADATPPDAPADTVVTPPVEPQKPQVPRKKTVKAPAVPAENPK